MIITGTPGDQLVVLQLPFGSFTPGQPTATVDVKAMVSPLADVGFALNFQAPGGFALGNDPLDNPTVDPSIFGSTVTSTASRAAEAHEDRISAPRTRRRPARAITEQYLITVDVAAGQTVTNLDITDLLPANLQFVQRGADRGPRRADDDHGDQHAEHDHAGRDAHPQVRERDGRRVDHRRHHALRVLRPAERRGGNPV